jgi:predicted nuclease of predicted toxin-antitoxin system
MKLLFDQNISHRILKLLSDRFHNSTSVKNQNLIDSLDKTIWEFAKRSNYIIVTQDSDFNDLNLLNGFPPKIIWIRAGNLRTEQLAKILEDHYFELEEFEKNSKFGCFEILAINK